MTNGSSISTWSVSVMFAGITVVATQHLTAVEGRRQAATPRSAQQVAAEVLVFEREIEAADAGRDHVGAVGIETRGHQHHDEKRAAADAQPLGTQEFSSDKCRRTTLLAAGRLRINLI